MIGSGITQGFSHQGFDVTEFNRSGKSVVTSNRGNNFDALEFTHMDDFSVFSGFDYIINLSGVIRHKISSGSSSDIENAIKVGKLIGERAAEKAIKLVAFDKGGHRYHGVIKALADEARKNLNF